MSPRKNNLLFGSGIEVDNFHRSSHSSGFVKGSIMKPFLALLKLVGWQPIDLSPAGEDRAAPIAVQSSDPNPADSSSQPTVPIPHITTPETVATA
jgi:hypothetical protein